MNCIHSSSANFLCATTSTLEGRKRRSCRDSAASVVNVLPASEAHPQPGGSHAVLRPQACIPEALLPGALLWLQHASAALGRAALPTLCLPAAGALLPSCQCIYTQPRRWVNLPLVKEALQCAPLTTPLCSIGNSYRCWEAHHLAVCTDVLQISGACREFTPALSGFGFCWRSLFIITKIGDTLHQPFQEAQHLIPRRSSFAAGAAVVLGNTEVHKLALLPWHMMH